MPGITELSYALASTKKVDLIEQKVDGSRHTYTDGKLISDRDIVRNARFKHIVEVLKQYDIKCRGEVALPDSNVLLLNREDSWPKAKYYIFELYSFNGLDFSKAGALKQREAIEMIVQAIGSEHISLPRKFASFEDGWNFVKENNLEGLVLKRDSGLMWKIKVMKEEKLLITGHEAGSEKGAFLIDRNGVQCRVSGTSVDYVKNYHTLLASGAQVYAEIEFLFVTEDGHPFQPRLRRIGTKEDLRIT